MFNKLYESDNENNHIKHGLVDDREKQIMQEFKNTSVKHWSLIKYEVIVLLFCLVVGISYALEKGEFLKSIHSILSNNNSSIVKEESKNETVTDDDNKNSDKDNSTIVNEIDVAKKFISILNSKDIESFKQMVSPSGLIVIRNFVSGNSARGNDIRNIYSAEEIPENLQLPINDEEAIDMTKLFPTSIKNSSEEIQHLRIKEKNFNFKDTVNGAVLSPSTSEVWELCGEIQRVTDNKTDSIPLIYILGDDEFALSEAERDFNTGTWAVFEKVDNRFYLRALLDFR